jgi:hypothetical protein
MRLARTDTSECSERALEWLVDDEAQKLDPTGNDDEAVRRVRRLDEEKLGSATRPDEAPEGK